MKNKTVRATTQARKNLAQKERASQRKVIDEKVAHARKQLEEDEDQWFRFLMEQREREVREAEERQRKNAERQKQSAEKTPEQRAEEARARQERDAERRRNPVDAAMTQGQSGQWNEYETKWASFVELEVIPMASIPWPPHSEKLLQWATQKQPESQNYKAKVKSAYKHCALRWHPDKFMGKYGSKLKEGERDAIQSRLNENFQILNASFTAALKGA
ncbi:hypothetical protein A3770_08p53080 [Chloropicon primus]|uniref:J domain-containing protein n=2 Tax=Chloropicon primus TaxID=1764295 RepID=A0A5B8MTM9_9CHLO|nr:hypothetical protein A3770_08p53080 [Chloropicon primus]|eukprot:QDZ22790.1 hypothetical protein A3770_08p53080 [Chloropicon primus]